ncbi:MAG: hypothetical protein ACI8QD_001143 [Cyclobacteriaceae bacterium]|jgi:hypothetical protein
MSTLTYGQTIDYAAELAKLEAELDSISIFNLFDSVINLSTRPKTELVFRASYSSSTIYVGRDYGVSQFGFSPGIIMYHKSGIYGDITGFFNSESAPNYNLTMISAGYLGSFAKRFTYGVSAERWLYPSGENAQNDRLTSNLGSFASVSFGPIRIGVDYSYLFGGNQTTNRLIPMISGQFTTKKNWVFDRISCLPSVSLTYGNDDIVIYHNLDIVEAYRQNELFNAEFSRAEFNEYLASLPLTGSERQLRDRILNNPMISEREKRKRLSLLYLAREDVQNRLLTQLSEVENQYGIMSYNFTIPIYLKINNWDTMFSYTYSIPQTLPGEILELDPVGFFSASISYRLGISSKTR